MECGVRAINRRNICNASHTRDWLNIFYKNLRRPTSVPRYTTSKPPASQTKFEKKKKIESNKKHTALPI